jgi:hypothetical protein
MTPVCSLPSMAPVGYKYLIINPVLYELEVFSTNINPINRMV